MTKIQDQYAKIIKQCEDLSALSKQQEMIRKNNQLWKEIVEPDKHAQATNLVFKFKPGSSEQISLSIIENNDSIILDDEYKITAHFNQIQSSEQKLILNITNNQNNILGYIIIYGKIKQSNQNGSFFNPSLIDCDNYLLHYNHYASSENMLYGKNEESFKKLLEIAPSLMPNIYDEFDISGNITDFMNLNTKNDKSKFKCENILIDFKDSVNVEKNDSLLRQLSNYRNSVQELEEKTKSLICEIEKNIENKTKIDNSGWYSKDGYLPKRLFLFAKILGSETTVEKDREMLYSLENINYRTEDLNNWVKKLLQGSISSFFTQSEKNDYIFNFFEICKVVKEGNLEIFRPEHSNILNLISTHLNEFDINNISRLTNERKRELAVNKGKNPGNL